MLDSSGVYFKITVSVDGKLEPISPSVDGDCSSGDGGGRGGSVALSTVRPENKSAGHFICTFQKTKLIVVLVVAVMLV